MLEQRLNAEDLNIERLQVTKENDQLTVVWQVSAKKKNLMQLTETLANTPEIICFS
jgi:putative Mg2+ transporter-C (MgtC) family protein